MALCAIVAVVVFVTTGDTGFDKAEFAAALQGANPWFILLSVVFCLLAYVARAFRWRVMMRPVCPDPSFRRLLSATLVGFTAVVFFGRPGEIVRPWLISRSERVPLASQAAAWFLERVLDLLAVLLLFGFALMQARPGSAAGPRLEAVIATGGMLALALGAFCVLILGISAFSADLARQLVGRLVSLLPLRFRDRLLGLFEAFLDGMRSTGSASSAGLLAGWTVIDWIIIVASVHLALLACPATAHFNVLDSIVFMGFVAFGSAVQLPGIGGGMQVTAILVGIELFGLTMSAATAVALVVWAVSWLTVVPIGLAIAFAEGLNWSALRHAGQAAEASQSVEAPPR